MGYNCYQKFKNRNPYIRLTRYLAIRNGVKTYIRGCSIAPVLAMGWIITAVFIALAIWWSKKKGIEVEVIPKLSMMTAVFFVVCLSEEIKE